MLYQIHIFVPEKPNEVYTKSPEYNSKDEAADGYRKAVNWYGNKDYTIKIWDELNSSYINKEQVSN